LNTYIYGLIIALFAILLLILAVGSAWINLFDEEAIMQCKKCGESVKYIKSHDNTEVYTVETTIIQVVKSNGREVGGYLLHVCEATGKYNDTNKETD